MTPLAIITDTDASLPVDLAERLEIDQVPILIQFGDETFKTGIDIDDLKVFRRIDREGKLPTTSAPAPGQFAQAYRQAFERGADSVICFCVSSKVSATYSAALTARETMPARDITVIDTLSLSMGQGFMVLAAAETAASGATRQEVIDHALEIGNRSYLYAALSTLKYLAMSGRVGHLAAGMATLLNVKPILTIQDGKLDMLERARTRKKSWERLIELTIEHLKGQPIERLAVVHVAAPDEANKFKELIQAQLPCPDEILISELTPGLSVHSGAGMVGLAYVAGK